MKFKLILIFFSIIITTACKQDKANLSNPKYDFLNKTMALYNGIWLQKEFKDNLEKESSIPEALKLAKNPLSLALNFKNLKHDTLWIEILSTKGHKLHFPLILRRTQFSYVFEFPALGQKTRNFIQLKISEKDTLLLIKRYNKKNLLISQYRYKKIKSRYKTLEKTITEFISTNLMQGSFKYGYHTSNLMYQFSILKNSKILGLDNFTSYNFILSKKATILRLKTQNAFSDYRYTKNKGLIYLHKLSKNNIGKDDYVLKYIYSVQSRSKYFVDNIVNLDIKQDYSNLYIKLSIKVPSNYTYSKDSLYREIINSGFFNYKIFHNGGILKTDIQFKKFNLGKLYTESGCFYFTELGQKKPSRNYIANLKIPKYAFHELPEGENELTLYIYQRPYSQAFKEQRRSNLSHVYIDKRKNWIWAKINFQVSIPKLIKRQIVLSKIKINKKSNVDATIVRNGQLADIYWAVFYPRSNQIYWISSVKSRNDSYIKRDTIKLYLDSFSNAFNVKVLDKDMGKKPDLIGEKLFQISELKKDFSNFEFGKVDSFELKLK